MAQKILRWGVGGCSRQPRRGYSGPDGERKHLSYPVGLRGQSAGDSGGSDPQQIPGKLILRECGASCGLTVAAARQQRDKALRSLRSGENGKLLRPFLPEDSWIYNNVLIGGGVGHFSHTWTSSTERVALEL